MAFMSLLMFLSCIGISRLQNLAVISLLGFFGICLFALMRKPTGFDAALAHGQDERTDKILGQTGRSTPSETP